MNLALLHPLTTTLMIRFGIVDPARVTMALVNGIRHQVTQCTSHDLYPVLPTSLAEAIQQRVRDPRLADLS